MKMKDYYMEKQRNLAKIMTNKRRQTQKSTYCVIPFKLKKNRQTSVSSLKSKW